MSYREGEPRVVISVSGGLAEEVVSLAVGPVHVFIVDFDVLAAASQAQVEHILQELPDDVQIWVAGELDR